MTTERSTADDTSELVIALTPGQAIALVAVLVAVFLLIRARKAE